MAEDPTEQGQEEPDHQQRKKVLPVGGHCVMDGEQLHLPLCPQQQERQEGGPQVQMPPKGTVRIAGQDQQPQHEDKRAFQPPAVEAYPKDRPKGDQGKDVAGHMEATMPAQEQGIEPGRDGISEEQLRDGLGNPRKPAYQGQ